MLSSTLSKRSKPVSWNSFVYPFLGKSNNIISSGLLHIIIGGHSGNNLKWNRWHREVMVMGENERRAICNAAGVEGG